MNDYTPNTESVRESIAYLAKYHAKGQHCDADLVVVESEVQGQFDRWLAEVQANAWDEGFKTSVRTNFHDRMPRLADNPYRKEQSDDY